jgi:phage terminase Nu1 subunit (DNA packaging protein)
MAIFMTKKDLAELTGYSFRRIFDIDRGLPDNEKLYVEGENKKYNAALFVQRWVDYCTAREKNNTEKSLDDIRAEHEAVKIEKTRLEVGRMKGKLIDVEEVKMLWGDICVSIRENFMKLPRRVAPLVRMMENTQIIESIIEEDVRNVLTTISETPLPDYARDDITGEYADAEEVQENL